MPALGVVAFKGASGKAYPFYAVSLDADLKQVGALYALTRRTKKDGSKESYNIIYMGQTSKLGETITECRKSLCLKQPNVNCVCVHLEQDEEQRKDKMADIALWYKQVKKSTMGSL